MITSRTLSLSRLLQLGYFEPAKVQREFQWRTAQVEKLLNDLVGAFQRMGDDPGEAEPDDPDDDVDESAAAAATPTHQGGGRRIAERRIAEPKRQVPDAYFLGSVILFAGKAATSLDGDEPGDTRFTVYDGLQRLTTITILLSILRDTWSDRGATDADAIAALLLDTQATDRPRRLSFPTSGQTLASVVSMRSVPRRDLTDGDYRMRDAVTFFAGQFDARWPAARRRAFLAFLHDKVQLTVTLTDNHSVAYQMFIGANSRGLRLDVGDVIKGMLADQVRRNGGTVAQVDICSTGWRDGQLRLRKGFNDFIHAVEVLKFRLPPQTFTTRRRLEKVHTTGEKLQAYFDDTSSPAEICEWVSGEFTRMVRIFERGRTHTRLPEAEGIDISLRQLSFLSWTEWHPLFIALGLRHDDLASPVFAAEVHDLQRACYIVELLSWSESARRRKFMQAIDQLELDVSPFRKIDRQTNGALYFHPGAKAQQAARRALRAPLTSEEKRGAIVRWMETLHWGARLPRVCTDDASVEHVLPIATVGDWAKAFTDDERDQWINRIGNLCLIDKQVNDRIGNKEWFDKALEYERLRNAHKSIDRVLATSRTLMSNGETRPWSAKTTAALTETLARVGEVALALT